MAEAHRHEKSKAESSVEGARFLIVEARYYEEVAAHLLEGAIAALKAADARYICWQVPGALEIPIAMKIALDMARTAGAPFQGAIALGCVVRGETAHFDIVAGESARALMDLGAGREIAARQWHPHGRGHGAGRGAGRSEAGRQGRRRGTRRAGAASAASRAGVALMARAPQRAAARLAAVQALYQMEVSGKGLAETQSEFESFWIGNEIEGTQYNEAEIAFFRDILSGVLAEQGPIDRAVDRTLAKGWPLVRVDAVMRAILRAGSYELLKRKDVPARVVIKEYVDVAGAFFERDEAGMINAVLDTLARQFRAEEFQAQA